MRNVVVTLGVVGLLSWPLAAGAQDERSPKAAAELIALMDAGKLQAFAAADPDEPGRYIAVMHIPGSQLLVISAQYVAPALMDDRLQRREYNQAYADLHGSSDVETKWFFQDLEANGLRFTRKPGEPFDLVYQKGVRFVMLDADWRGQDLGEAEYRSRRDTADQRYARMLTVLAAALRTRS